MGVSLRGPWNTTSGLNRLPLIEHYAKTIFTIANERHLKKLNCNLPSTRWRSMMEAATAIL